MFVKGGMEHPRLLSRQDFKDGVFFKRLPEEIPEGAPDAHHIMEQHDDKYLFARYEMVAASKKFSYVYKVTCNQSGQYYIGLRSCDVDPHRDPYMGSGILIRRYIRVRGRENFTKTIIEIFDSRESASLLESKLVTVETLEDPLCLNLMAGGEITYPKAFAEVVRQRISVSVSDAYAKDPTFSSRVSESLKNHYRDNPHRSLEISEMRKALQNDSAHKAREAEATKARWAAPGHAEKMELACQSQAARQKRSKSMKDYSQTAIGQQNLQLATKGTIYVNKDDRTKRIKPHDVDSYLKDGWVLGSALRTEDTTRMKLSAVSKGRVWMSNPDMKKRCRANPEDIDILLSDGWVIGNLKWDT